MVNKGNIGRVVLGCGRESVTLHILHEELGREACLTLKEAKRLRDRLDEAIAEIDAAPEPRVRMRRKQT